MKKLSLIALMLFGFYFQIIAQETESEIWSIVQQMPRFPGCEELQTLREKNECSNQKFMEYIYENLEYPEEAIKNKTEGRVVMRFTVTKDGSIKNVKILRDIGNGCGEAAKKVILSMNNMEQKWIPGSQGGRKVNVYFTVPVIFKLTDEIFKKHKEKHRL